MARAGQYQKDKRAKQVARSHGCSLLLSESALVDPNQCETPQVADGLRNTIRTIISPGR
jgi:hypothetical protein